ncbi:hypothetical protein [Scleromatobacter humisilvae]|uniref:Secreted protein n=1 Tax=Scleromatobacter humisilvae TaxID=2897159 RepID=A0A9X1YL69_9BURK|nr:hypothetical protein [Scleromatobacter humisilvae]MCK9687986.1 hypothetical protein [Scleromatobacter humisilvae]
MSFDTRKQCVAFAAAVLSAAAVPTAFAQTATPDVATVSAEALMQENWRETIARTAVPHEGCFEAEFPNAVWVEARCTVAPDKVYVPHRSGGPQTVGNGVDYAATVTNLMSAAVGTFPTVTGVTSEKDGSSNVYSIQLNSNFMSTAACNGHSGCLAWEQFVYSSSETAAFMQYWLIDYGNSCPSGWNAYQGSCYKNSAAVTVPKEPITSLATLKLSGTAVNGGNDTLVFTAGSKAYSTTGRDSVTYLATAWKQAEFNIIGDGGGSKATFNSGSSVTVKVAVTHGSTTAPTCASNAGTTGETNNLTLRSCSGVSGATPYIQFVESN